MINFSAVSEIEAIEAKVQARVGEFLGCKKRIITLYNSYDPDIRRKAAGLLAMQRSLEEQLAETLTLIEKVKKDTYAISDILKAGSFAVLMERHIREVESLEKEAKGISVKPVLADVSTKMLWVVVGIAFLWLLFRKK